MRDSGVITRLDSDDSQIPSTDLLVSGFKKKIRMGKSETLRRTQGINNTTSSFYRLVMRGPGGGCRLKTKEKFFFSSTSGKAGLHSQNTPKLRVRILFGHVGSAAIIGRRGGINEERMMIAPGVK